MVTQLASHPSIVQWVVFNEGWGEYAPAPVVDLVLSLDASRLVSSASGWVDNPSGSVREKRLAASMLEAALPYPGQVKASQQENALMNCQVRASIAQTTRLAGARRSRCQGFGHVEVRG